MDDALPMVLPVHDRADLDREACTYRLREVGAILFRGLDVETADEFESLVTQLAGDPLEYRERSTPRSRVSGNVYTSTEYPPMYPIFLHNESSYASSWPEFLFFFCQTPATAGGETPIASMRRITEEIAPAIRERFADRGVMYVRNFREDIGLSWQTAFSTDDPEAVERYCRDTGIEAQWIAPDHLRTRQVRPAFRRHPITGEELWFNHALVFHVSTLVPDVRQALTAIYPTEDLPVNSYYGDGSPLEESLLDELRHMVARHQTSFPWARGDVLMIDNMLVAHGRAPFTGPRKILVAMAGQLTATETGIPR